MLVGAMKSLTKKHLRSSPGLIDLDTSLQHSLARLQFRIHLPIALSKLITTTSETYTITYHRQQSKNIWGMLVSMSIIGEFRGTKLVYKGFPVTLQNAWKNSLKLLGIHSEKKLNFSGFRKILGTNPQWISNAKCLEKLIEMLQKMYQSGQTRVFPK